MADHIAKIRIDTQEYDAKLKTATDALSRYFDKVREGGGTLTHLDDGVMDAVRALGEMGTKASGTRGSLREMTQALTDLTSQYRALTDEERGTPLGQEMARSIQALTERAGNARDAMADVQASITNAASDTRRFDQLAQGASVMTAGFQTAQGAAKLLGIDLGDNVEILAKLQAAMAVTNGLTTIQTALQKQSALMQGVMAARTALATAAQTAYAAATGNATAAQTVFNAVANANPYVLLATAIGTVLGALAIFSSSSGKAKEEEEKLAKAAEEAAKRIEETRQAYVDASAASMNTASRISSLQIAYKNANDEISKTSILRQAQVEFKKLGLECKTLGYTQTLLVQHGGSIAEMIRLQGDAAAVAALRMEAFKKSFKMLLGNGYGAESASILAGYNADVQALDKRANAIQARIEGVKAKLPSSGGSGVGGGGNNTPPVVGSIDEQTAKVQALQKAWRAAADDTSRADIKRQLEAAQAVLDQMQGKNIVPEGSTAGLQKQLQDLQRAQSLATSPKEWRDYQRQIDATTDRIAILKGTLPKDKEAKITVAVNSSEALADLQKIGKVDFQPLTVTVTAKTDEAAARLESLGAVRIADKQFTVQANTSGILDELQKIADVDFQPLTVTVTAKTDEAAARLESIGAVRIDDKQFSVTANTGDTLNDLQKIADVDIQPLTVTVTVKTDEALQKIQNDIAGQTVSVEVVPKVKPVEKAQGISITTSKGLQEWISYLQQDLSQADLGSAEYNDLAAQLADTTMLQNLVGESLKVGLGTAMFDVADETGRDFWAKVLDKGGVEDADWQAIADVINKKRKELGLDEIKVNFKTGSVDSGKEKDSDKAAIQGWQTLTSSLSSITGGLQKLGIELPEGFTKTITVLQTIVGIVSAIQTISAIDYLIPFANGGIVPHAANGYYVPGNSYSGDRTPILANAGELVLNSAQQGILASELSERQSAPAQGSPYVEGEKIFLGVNNYLRRSGRGEIVTSR